MGDHSDIDHTGLTGTGGNVATDTIWDAAGDLAVGSGANTAAKLTKGSNGNILTVTAGVVGWAAGAGASALQSARYVRSAGNYTITGAGSTTFADVDGTNLSFTITTGARRCLIVVQAVGYVNNAAGAIGLDIDLDGARLGGATGGLCFMAQHATASEQLNLSFPYVTDTLSAASHTFKLQWLQANTAHTATLFGSDPRMSMSVVELYA